VETEDGGICTDAESQRQRGNGCKAWGSRKHPKGVANFL
jgi:hypothetical protein